MDRECLGGTRALEHTERWTDGNTPQRWTESAWVGPRHYTHAEKHTQREIDKECLGRTRALETQRERDGQSVWVGSRH